MVCQACGAENRAERKFCSQCATPLAVACPACGAANEPGERYCGECAAPLQSKGSGPQPTVATASSQGPVSERRLVAVLFADLVGFTTLSERRDPEDVRELLARYFERAREVIGRYGGVVEKFIGDAVMAVWGTPVAHEDDAERAVRAALELTDAIEALGIRNGVPDLRLRAGVLSGEAAVTLGAQGEGMVAGDLVNTAARLQSVAAPGSVLVGHSTYLATQRAIGFEPAGAHVLKGKDLPVEAWRAIRVVAGAGGFRRDELLEPPFVGRVEEFRLIKEALHAVERDHKPRLVSIVGIGGIGKSRMAWELLKYIDGFVKDVYWHQGRAPAYGDGVSFWALGEMVRMRAGIAETDDDVVAQEKLDAAVQTYIADPEDRRWIAPRLAQLLGLQDGGEGDRDELFASWRVFFEAVASRGPAVLVFEDMQWADDGLADFVEYLVDRSRSSPILVVTLARPEFLERRPTWAATLRNVASIRLDPLAEDEMRVLVEGLAPAAADPMLASIVERAEGVPLYAVETVRMLIDQGVLVLGDMGYRLTQPLGRLDIPSTLHALIAARLDTLPPEDRSLLGDASVLGQTFTLESLRAFDRSEPNGLEQRLEALVRRDLLVVDADPRSPERGQYGFVQSLIREIAYQTLARKDRRSRHLAAARFFESLGDDELAPIVATHYVEAYRSAPDTDDAEAILAQAEIALMAAADRAASLGSPAQALAHVEQALDVARDPDRRAALSMRAGRHADAAARFDEARSYFESAIEHYAQRDDRAALGRATASLGRVLVFSSQVDEAILTFEKALAQAHGETDQAWVAELLAGLATAYMTKGEARKSTEMVDRALEMAERLDLPEVVMDALITGGYGKTMLGRLREGEALLRGVLALASAANMRISELRAYNALCWCLQTTRPREAMSVAEAGLDLARRLGMLDHEATLIANFCEFAFYSGEWNRVDSVTAETDLSILPPIAFLWAAMWPAVVAGLRGDPTPAAKLVPAFGEVERATSAPQDLAAIRLGQAWLSLFEGKLLDSFELAMEAAEVDRNGGEASWATIHAGQIAVWSRDPVMIDRALQSLENIPWAGPIKTASRSLLQGAGDLLSDLPETGRTLYQSGLAELKEIGLDFHRALWQLGLVSLLGEDDPDGAKAREEARATITDLGASRLLELVDPIRS